MAKKFNLLPTNQESKKYKKVNMLINRIAVATFVIFLLLLIGLSSTLFLLSRRLSGIELEISKYKTQISALESAEAGLVVAKDRAQKISSIFELRQNEAIYNKYLKVIDALPETIELREINLDDTETEMSFRGSNSKDFSDFIDWLMINEDQFSIIYANNVGLSQGMGYVLSVEAK